MLKGVVELTAPPARALDIRWALPGKKRAFASSSTATSDLIKIYAEDGATWRQILAKISYDRDAAAIAAFYVTNGFGDISPTLTPLLDENSYTLWWPGKRKAILESDSPIDARLTMRPM